MKTVDTTISFRIGDVPILLNGADRVLRQRKWYLDRGYVRHTKHQKGVFLHREVMSNMLGRKLAKGEQVLHINGDLTDNRRENLRLGRG